MEPIVPGLVPRFRASGAPRRRQMGRPCGGRGSSRNQRRSHRLSSGLIAGQLLRSARRRLLAWMMDRLVERATLCGIEAEYRDAFGHLRTVEPEVLARLVEVLQ